MTPRRLVLATLGMVLALVVAAVLWWRSTLLTPTGHGWVTYEVEPGTSIQRALHDLENNGLIHSALSGRVYYELFGKRRSLHWGAYRFEPQTRPIDVIEALLEGRVETFSLTSVEGMTSDEVWAVLQEHGIRSADGWPNIMTRVEWVESIAPQASSLEGFLFPDTYSFAVGTTAETIVHHMTRRFHEVWAEVRRDGLVLEPYETVILASLVEAETSVPEERARVSGVFVNRLTRGMLLQCDPTVVFALKRRDAWEGRLLRIHWELDDPYNTYRYPGLPPGPINNPGRASLQAAARPETHDLLYFVAKADGGHAFSRTLREHNRHVARLYRSRR